MAIYTRFGSEVKIVAFNTRNHYVTIKYSDGKTNNRVWITDLKADGGLNEICLAVKDAEKIKHYE